MRAIKELHEPGVRLHKAAPALHAGRKAVPGQYYPYCERKRLRLTQGSEAIWIEDEPPPPVLVQRASLGASGLKAVLTPSAHTRLCAQPR